MAESVRTLISVLLGSVCAQAAEARKTAIVANNSFADFMSVSPESMDAPATKRSWVLKEEPHFIVIG